MDHLLGTLPGCSTLEEAEENYRLDAMQMELRERRVRDWQRTTSIKEIETHLDGLKDVDADIYTTYLYTTARLGMVFSELSDNQLRRALSAVSLAIHKLYDDHEVIRPSVSAYRANENKIDDVALNCVRARVNELLPKMIAVVASEAGEDIPVRHQQHYGAEGMKLVPIPAEDAVSPTMAEAVFRLRVLAYIRHPIDLIREINRWISDMESSE